MLTIFILTSITTSKTSEHTHAHARTHTHTLSHRSQYTLLPQTHQRFRSLFPNISGRIDISLLYPNNFFYIHPFLCFQAKISYQFLTVVTLHNKCHRAQRLFSLESLTFDLTLLNQDYVNEFLLFFFLTIVFIVLYHIFTFP